MLAAALLAGFGLPATAHAAPPSLPQPSAATVLVATSAPTAAAEPGRPRNGAVFTKRGSGSGQFTVDNSGNGSDAVITLSDGARAVLVMYVRAGEKATATKVPNGDFDVFSERGRNWNSVTGRFDGTSSAGHFDRKAGFTSKRTSKGTTYTKITLTLHEVAHGNTKESPVSDSSVPN
ncbi:hypothetical protein [Actinomycetospora termitidis]|uniref:Uncharacterized protein n=1 Tax=Actinomycetospora termitidis TaxID=3053470 RepID=A0ABT7MEC7_9PSEU|nr:hypothetical protein [Actinomycetospora sp. Odt1-22]MDL5159015.1 hypothetical protein [Actinomycetospora sp. Odt1-22]